MTPETGLAWRRLTGAFSGLAAVAILLVGCTAIATTPMQSGIGRLVGLTALVAEMPLAKFALGVTPLHPWLPRTPRASEEAMPFLLFASSFGLAGKFADLAIAEWRSARRQAEDHFDRGAP